MSKSNKPRSLAKKPEGHLIPEEGQINFTQCCSFKPPEEWRIISRKMEKPGKKFISMTISNGGKKLEHSNESSSRGIQSKETMSRELSHESSREVFEKVKKDFIEQLKLWKEEDVRVPETVRPSRERSKQASQYNSDPYFATNPEEEQQSFYWEENEGCEQDQRESRNWMIPELNSIEEVGVNLETSSGLKTQSSAMFSVFEG